MYLKKLFYIGRDYMSMQPWQFFSLMTRFVGSSEMLFRDHSEIYRNITDANSTVMCAVTHNARGGG